MARRSLPWIWIIPGLGAVLLVLLAAGAWLWVGSFLRSDDFRKLVEDQTSKALHSDVSYSPFRWSGASVFSDRIQAVGQPDSVIKTFQANAVRAEVNWRSAFDGAWRIEEITTTYFEGTFRPPVQATAASASLPPATPGGLKQFLPRRFEIGVLQVAQARLNFLDKNGVESLALKDSTLQLRPEGSGWLLSGQRGTLTVPGQPALDVDQFSSRLQKGTFFLTSFQSRLGSTGRVSASGEFGPESHLRPSWQQVDIEPFLPRDWKGRISGLLAGEATVLWAADPKSATATGKFKLTEGLLQNIEVLNQIASFTSTPQFRRMPLQELSSDFSWKGNQLVLTNLIAESKGLLRVEGSCTIERDGQLAGTIRVGVSAQTLQWLPGSRERVFVQTQNGYLWTDVRLSGTLETPQEDLSARLVNALRDEAIQQGTNIIRNAPEAAREGVRQAIDLLSPLGR